MEGTFFLQIAFQFGNSGIARAPIMDKPCKAANNGKQRNAARGPFPRAGDEIEQFFHGRFPLRLVGMVVRFLSRRGFLGRKKRAEDAKNNGKAQGMIENGQRDRF